jgi:hypothetical protein
MTAKQDAIRMFKRSNPGVKFTVKQVQRMKKIVYPTGRIARYALFEFRAAGFNPSIMEYNVAADGKCLRRSSHLPIVKVMQ